MRYRIPLAALAALLVLPLAGGTLAQGPGSMGEPNHFQPPAGGNQYVGDFVSFVYDGALGRVLDYGGPRGNFIALQAIDVGVPLGQPTTEGAVFGAVGGSTTLAIHDNPTLLVQIRTNATRTVRLTLGMLQVQGEDFAPSNHSLLLKAGGFRAAVLVMNGTLAVVGRTVTVNLSAGGGMIFRLRPTSDPAPGLDLSLLEGIARKRLGAEVTLGLRGGQPDLDAVAYRMSLRIQPAQVHNNSLALQVRDDLDPRGTVILLRLSPGLVRLQRQGALTLTLDGSPLTLAQTPDGVLRNDGTNLTDATYYPLVDRTNLVLLLVYIPHFSLHTLTLEALQPLAVRLDPAALATILAGVAIAGTAALVIFRRR